MLPARLCIQQSPGYARKQGKTTLPSTLKNPWVAGFGRKQCSPVTWARRLLRCASLGGVSGGRRRLSCRHRTADSLSMKSPRDANSRVRDSDRMLLYLGTSGRPGRVERVLEVLWVLW